MKHQTFETYILVSARTSKPGPRAEAIEYMRDMSGAGAFPPQTQHHASSVGKFVRNAPRQHREVIGRLFKEWQQQKVVREARAAAERAHKNSNDSLRKRAQVKRKTFSLMQLMSDP